MTTKNYFHHWEQYVKKLLNVAPVPVAETKAQQAQRMSALEADPEKWFKYYFPTESAEPAPFHKAATKRILNNPEWYEVRMWSRELAKSTRTMMEVLYLTLVGHPPSALRSVSPLSICHPDPSGVSPDPSGKPHEEPINNLPLTINNCKKQHILLISNSLDNAARLLIPYKANMELNPRIINDYGTQQCYGTWTATEFTTRTGTTFRAVGAGQPPRGAKNRSNARPDVILFDDIDTDVACRNTEMISKTWKWIEEAAIGTRSVSGATTIIFCGNRIAPDCCVVRACKYADHVDEVNIVDAEGNPSWPQKNTLAHIERVLSQKSYASAQKEYFNNPVTEGAVFKQMNYKPILPLHQYNMLVCYTDPSYKNGPKNDYKATVLVGRWRDEYHIIKCFVEQTSTAQMIDWHYQIMKMVIGRHEVNPHSSRDLGANQLSHSAITQLSHSIYPSQQHLGAENLLPCTQNPSIHNSSLINHNSVYYYMEEVLLQDLILDEFYKEGRKRGQTIPIMGDQRRKGHKYTRIEALLEPLHRNNLLYLNEAEKNNPHMRRLDEQFVAFAPGSRAHDDAPDAVEGAIWIINNKTITAASKNITIIKRHPHSKRF